MVLEKGTAQRVFEVRNLLWSVYVLWLHGLGVVLAMTRWNRSDECLGRRYCVHDFEPRRLGRLVAGEKVVVQFMADGLEDPRGSYLAWSSHGMVLTAEFFVCWELI